jgi:hypothetical protein
MSSKKASIPEKKTTQVPTKVVATTVSTPKPAPQATAKPISASGVVTIKMDEEKIRVMAYEFSTQPKTYDDFVWLLAENELKLKPAYQNETNPFISGLPSSVTLFPSKINEYPKQAETKNLAELIAASATPIQDVHWFLAERVFVYQSAKPKRF